ncbi:MAG: PAS domain-containing protein [Sulfuritalea sp.]|nr:PAS domain-containing protein [Sulfuritalea sp.]MDP1983466.1 PAS domain-containing protein [Sulfuritalea sp.]
MGYKASPSRRSTFVLITLVVTISALAASAYTLWRLQVEAVDRHADAARTYAHAFEDHLTQTFKFTELTLINALSNPGDRAQTRSAFAAALRRAPYLRSLALVDAQGTILASSEPRDIGVRIVRADFLPFTTAPRAILRVGPPWAGRNFHDGLAASREQPLDPESQSLIPLLLDVVLADGTWTTLLASVNTDHFLNHYESSLGTGAGVVELLRYDGTLLLSTDTARTPGIRSIGDTLASRIEKEDIGQFRQQLASGRDVLTAFRASSNYPFLIVVHLDKQSGLAGWRRAAAQTLLVVTIALLVALAFAGLYYVRTERAAAEHDAALKQLRLQAAALDAAANSIIITNRQAMIEWANPAFCALSGYGIDDVLGQSVAKLVKSGVQAPEVYRDLWNTILAGKVWRGEMINRRKDGTCYLEGQTITPVRDEDGTVRYFIAVKQDISERRQSEKRMEELSRHLVVVQESARRRLSGELHDRTSPNLAAISVNLHIMAGTLLEAPSPMRSERLEDMRALIEDTAASIREICSDLRPPVLDYAGLVAALESYVKQFYRRTGITVRLDCTHSATRLPPEQETMLFRIVQEALTNCAKHSRAGTIQVRLKLDAKPVTLLVDDDGIGFDPQALGKTTHTGGLGILTMKEMAELSGGSFTLESAPGTGTRIKVEIHSMEGPT